MKIWEGRLRTLWGEWVVFSFGVEAVGFRRQQLRYNMFGGPFRQKNGAKATLGQVFFFGFGDGRNVEATVWVCGMGRLFV